MSKILLHDWVGRISLEYLLACMSTWHQVTLPGYLQTTAEFLERMFLWSPLIGTASAAICLGAETFWFTSYFRGRFRYVVPLTMYVAHILIFLGSGIRFFGLATAALSFVLPWRKLRFRRQPSTSTVNAVSASERAIGWVDIYRDKATALHTAIVLAAIVAPQIRGSYHPFSEFNFGWYYEACCEPIVSYRLGFRNPKTGDVQLLPANYYGFMDFKGISKQHAVEALVRAENDEERAIALQRVKEHVGLIRPYGSNRWLLGGLSYPPHLARTGPKFRLDEIKYVFPVEGRIDYRKRRGQIDWMPITEWKFPVPTDGK